MNPSKPVTLNVNNRLLIISQPVVMGIINVTPDSFYKGSRAESEKSVLETAAKMLEDGATFLDIGGYSTRPGAEDISMEEESGRVLPVISAINKEFPNALISIDTFRSEVARRAVENGASIINDVSGGQLDTAMFHTIARLNVPYVLMHMRGTPQTMTSQTEYTHLVKDILQYFAEKIEKLQQAGVKDIIIDPGFGFAKTIDQNFELLNHLNLLKTPGRLLMAGVSRKSMVWKTLETTPDHALNGTSALHMAALMNGADILRTHDVAEAIEVIKLFRRLKKV